MMTKPEILRWKNFGAPRLATHVKWPDGSETYEGISRAVCEVWRRDALLSKKLLLMDWVSIVWSIITLAVGAAWLHNYMNVVYFIVSLIIFRYISCKRFVLIEQYEKTAPTVLLVTAVLDGYEGETELIYKGQHVAQLMEIVENTVWNRPAFDYAVVFEQE
jgi:hypothetical protein